MDEGDLHRFVDGLLDPQRQSEVMLRLKTRASEATQVAAWREQNELLRATFAGVEHDPVPTSLRLTPLRLRCIGDDERALDAMAPVLAQPLAPAPRRRVSPAHVAVATGLCIALVALGALWLMLSRSEPARPNSLLLVASREADGVLATPAYTGVDRRAPGEEERTRSEDDLPTATIPDLAPVGFEFTGATLRASLPRALVFSYQDTGSARLTLSVSRIGGAEAASRIASAGTLAWQQGGRSFVLSGDGTRLAMVAAYLQSVADASR